MPVNIEREDLRKTKTKKALYLSLSSLLDAHSFEKLTVTDICERALISRATFYTYFLDKYDLLKYWLLFVWSKNEKKYSNYGQIEKEINKYIHENEAVLKNLLYEADNETLGVIFEFIVSILDLSLDKNAGEGIYCKNIVLSNLYAGGLIFYSLWQVKNRFPSDVEPMNIYLYDIINKFHEWKVD